MYILEFLEALGRGGGGGRRGGVGGGTIGVERTAKILGFTIASHFYLQKNTHNKNLNMFLPASV